MPKFVVSKVTNTKGPPVAALGPTFCFGLTRANTAMWGKRVWSSWGSKHNLARPSPVTHRSNWCTNEETEGGGNGTWTLPSMDSQHHSPGKKKLVLHNYYCVYALLQKNQYKKPCAIQLQSLILTLIFTSLLECYMWFWQCMTWFTLTRTRLQYQCVFFLDEVELSRYMARR